MGGTYYVVLSASRILNASLVDQSGSDDGNVTGWPTANHFVVATLVGTSKGPIARTYKLRWRNVSDGGSFADIASTGEINFTAITNVVDGDSVTTGSIKCSATPEPTAIAGLQSEGDNILPDSGTFSVGDEEYAEFWWALSADDGLDGKEYEFDLYDVTTGTVIGTLGATITTEAGSIEQATGQSSETDLAQSASSKKTKIVGQYEETNLSQPVSENPIRRLVNQTSETDLTQSLLSEKTKAVTLSPETDFAQSATAGKAKAAGQLTETDLAHSVSVNKAKAVGQVFETDLAQLVSEPGGINQSVGLVTETNLTQSLSCLKEKVVGQNAETDLVQTLMGLKEKAIGQNVETSSIQSLTSLKEKVVGQSTETGLIFAVFAIKEKTIAQALEVNASQELIWNPKSRLVKRSEETSIAQQVTIEGAILQTVLQSSETDIAQQISVIIFVLVLLKGRSQSSQSTQSNQKTQPHWW